jgi:hypothetical protein
MSTAALRVRLDDANRLLTLAENELDTAMHELTATVGGHKALISTVLEDAFTKLREARRDVAALERLLEDDGGSQDPEPK